MASFGLQDVVEAIEKSDDAFGNRFTLGTTVEADLGSHYPYSAERYRVFVNGTRKFIQYNGNPTEFDDADDTFTLAPQNDGDVVTFRTAEKFRYVVQYIIEWSAAFETNQDLQSGDVWAVAFGDPDLNNSSDDTPGPSADGWIVYQNSSHANDTATLAEYRDGTAKATRDITFTNLPQTWGRAAGRTNWYNVGITEVEETHTQSDDSRTQQYNDDLGAVANDTGKGPISGNQYMQASIKTGSSGAASLELDVGSIGVRTLGAVRGVFRSGTFPFSLSYSGTTGQYEPVMAIRVDPDREFVNTQLKTLEPLNHSKSDDTKVMARVFDPSNVLNGSSNTLSDADYSTPNELSSTDNVIETSTAVEEVPDSSGTSQTSMADPGGYQIGYGSLTASNKQGLVSARSRSEKRFLPGDNVAVLMIRSPSTGTIDGDIQFEEDW